MESQLSILIVSSPSPSHPTTLLLQKCIDSIFQCLPELRNCKIIVVLDGYKLVPTERLRPKSGKIDEALEAKYNGYHANLDSLFKHSDYTTNSPLILRSPVHLGFANCVKLGLEATSAPYCLICQHDRKFIRKFPIIKSLVDTMESNDQIRYVGFPSINNATFNNTTRSKYMLDYLNGPKFRKTLVLPNVSNESRLADGSTITVDVIDDISIADGIKEVDLPSNNSSSGGGGGGDAKGSAGNNIFLQPLIFWYDSQHICHVKRYLEIYRPFTNIPIDLKRAFGTPIVKKMIMRNGDFIEDRFGQMQRDVLARLAKGGDEAILERAFNWFGSYLLWEQDKLYDLTQLSATCGGGSSSGGGDSNSSSNIGGSEEGSGGDESCIHDEEADVEGDIEEFSGLVDDTNAAYMTNSAKSEHSISESNSNYSSSNKSGSAAITETSSSLPAASVLSLSTYPPTDDPPTTLTGIFIDPEIFGYCSHTAAVFVQHMDGRRYDQERVDHFNKLFEKNISI